MPRLSIIVPVYNEEPSLREVLGDAPQHALPYRAGMDPGGRLLHRRFQSNFGRHRAPLPRQNAIPACKPRKGAAIRQGLSQATGELVMIQDADFEYDPRDVPDLLAPLLAERADVVYGSRFKQSVTQVHRTYHYFVNRFLTTLSNLLSGIYVTDMETCYKIFRTDLVRAMKLRSDRFGIEIELTAYIAKTSARIFELPIHYYPRTYLQGKKINWKDGVAALFHLVRFNLLTSREEAFDVLPRNYLPQRQRKLRAVPLVPAHKE